MTAPDPITTARKQFPILNSKGATIDWQLVQDHGKQAHSNHYQTVERLAERGGLSWQELYYVLTDQPFVFGSGMIGTEDAINGCRLIERRYLGDDTAALKEELEKLKAERDDLKSEVTAYRNEAEQSRVLLDQADTREKIAVSDIYDRDNIIRDLLKKIRDHEARVEELEGALAKIAANKHRPISLMSMPPIDQRAQWAEDALRRSTLSKGIAKPTKP